MNKSILIIFSLVSIGLVLADQKIYDTETACILSATKPNSTSKLYHAVDFCVMAEFASYLSFGNSSYLDLSDGQVNQSTLTCGTIDNVKQEQKLIIDFRCGSLTFEIRHNDSVTFVKTIDGSFTVNNQTKTFKNDTELFKTCESGHYYKCNKEQPVIVNTDDGKKIDLILSKFSLEAFRKTKDTKFYQIPEECDAAGQVNDWVKIGVGVSLIALVAIVIIAYFVGRRRWLERSSYESV